MVIKKLKKIENFDFGVGDSNNFKKFKKIIFLGMENHTSRNYGNIRWNTRYFCVTTKKILFLTVKILFSKPSIIPGRYEWFENVQVE